MSLYCAVQDIRNFTNVQTPEFSDAQLLTLATGATNLIDLQTGRTWQGVATASDEYYDGTGTSKLWLNRMDIVSLASCSIDDNNDQTFTTITVSKVDTYSEGILHLQDDAEVTTFTTGHKNVKVTYTYGSSSVPDYVRHLSLLMVSQMLDTTPEGRASKQTEIDRIIKLLRNVGAEIVTQGIS